MKAIFMIVVLAFCVFMFSLGVLVQRSVYVRETADHAQQIAALDRQINRLQADLRRTESALMAKDLICGKGASK